MTIPAWSGQGLPDGQSAFDAAARLSLERLTGTIAALRTASATGGGTTLPYNAVTYGLTGNGVTDDVGALDTLANTTIPSAGGTIHFPPEYEFRIATDVTIPRHVTSRFHAGTRMIVDGCTVHFNGPVDAEPTYIFELQNDGTVTFGATAVPHGVWPEWWGAKPGDATVDSAPALQAAFIAAAGSVSGTEPSGSGIVNLATTAADVDDDDYYLVKSPVLSRGRLGLQGQGPMRSIITPKGYQGPVLCVAPAHTAGSLIPFPAPGLPYELGVSVDGSGSCYDRADVAGVDSPYYLHLTDCEAFDLNGFGTIQIEGFAFKRSGLPFAGGPWLCAMGVCDTFTDNVETAYMLWMRAEYKFTVRMRDKRATTSVTRSGNVVTVVCPAAHGLVDRDWVEMRWGPDFDPDVGNTLAASYGGSNADDPWFTGSVQVLVVNPTTFTYRMQDGTHLPGLPASPTIPLTYTAGREYTVTGGVPPSDTWVHMAGVVDGTANEIRLYAGPAGGAAVLIGTTAIPAGSVIDMRSYVQAILGKSIPRGFEEGNDITFLDGKIDSLHITRTITRTAPYTAPTAKHAWVEGESRALLNFDEFYGDEQAEEFIVASVDLEAGQHFGPNKGKGYLFARTTYYAPVGNVRLRDFTVRGGSIGILKLGVQNAEETTVSYAGQFSYGRYDINNNYSSAKFGVNVISARKIGSIQSIASGANAWTSCTLGGADIAMVQCGGSEDSMLECIIGGSSRSYYAAIVKRSGGGFSHWFNPRLSQENIFPGDGQELGRWRGQMVCGVENMTWIGGLVEPLFRPALMLSEVQNQKIVLIGTQFVARYTAELFRWPKPLATGQAPIELIACNHREATDNLWTASDEKDRVVEYGNGYVRRHAKDHGNVTGATSISALSGPLHRITMIGNTTLTVTDVSAGMAVRIKAYQDATGGRTLSWMGGITWEGGAAPAHTGTASKMDEFELASDNGSTIYGRRVAANY